MNLLLDTHALIWWAIDHPKLSRRVRAALGSSKHVIYVSAASAWEIATKARLGKLHWPDEAGPIEAYLHEQGFEPLPISVQHAERAGHLASAHRDPFDRMLIAQATAGDLAIASNETLFDAFGVRRIW